MAKRLSISGFLSYADVEELLSCSHDTVVRMWQAGKFPAPIDDPDLGPRFREDEVTKWVANRLDGPRRQPRPRKKKPPDASAETG